MASVPGASAEARDAQNRIYAIEAKGEMASRQAVAQAAAERERQRPSVEGRWHTGGWVEFQITKNGEKFDVIPGLMGVLPNQWVATDITVDRQRVRFGVKNLYLKCPECSISYLDLSLSESGNELKGTSTLNGKTYPNMTFQRIP
jgi:hypothetical protein